MANDGERDTWLKRRAEDVEHVRSSFLGIAVAILVVCGAGGIVVFLIVQNSSRAIEVASRPSATQVESRAEFSARVGEAFYFEIHSNRASVLAGGLMSSPASTDRPE